MVSAQGYRAAQVPRVQRRMDKAAVFGGDGMKQRLTWQECDARFVAYHEAAEYIAKHFEVGSLEDREARVLAQILSTSANRFKVMAQMRRDQARREGRFK